MPTVSPMRIRVGVDIAEPPEVVWADVARIASHAEWMQDAEKIDFLSDQTEGVGVEIDVATKVGPFRTADRMVFIAWEPPHRMGVEHQGLFTGSGEFTLAEIPTGTRFEWTESITFPWYLGGPIGAFVARPILRRIWRRNLSNLRERFTPR